jgi:two-component system CheB/CheR fusion protein
MHGGTVTAHSDGEGKGSEFVVRLPIASPRVVEPASERPRPHLGEGAKILVVEDNRDSREMLCELMEQAGFTCKTAETGTEALEIVEELRPQIAVLDLGLPEIDGFEVARRIRANPTLAGIWLIALTGYGQASDRQVGQEAGFDEHLVKPVDTDELLRLLEQMRAVPSRKHPRAAQPTARSSVGSFATGRTAEHAAALESDD